MAFAVDTTTGETVRKIRDALEANGVEFMDENGGGPGFGCGSEHRRKG